MLVKSGIYRENKSRLYYQLINSIRTFQDPVATLGAIKFNNQDFYVMLTEFIYGFCIDLGTTNCYFPKLNDWVW